MLVPADKVSAVVLAGGKSRRMGQDKRFLELEGRPLLARVLDTLGEVFEDVWISAADEAPELARFGRRVVPDVVRDAAALGGLYSALQHGQAPRLFITACDMPFLNASLVRFLLELNQKADVVMPRLLTGYQPTHAIYGKSCLPHLGRMIGSRRLKLQDLIENRELNVHLVEEETLRGVDPLLLSFMNVNTPADLEFASKALAGLSRTPRRAPA